MEDYRPEQVLELWFPDSGHQHDPQRHAAFWDERMQGGMDAVITARFAGLTEAAAKGLLDHWADTPRGRLALLIALDQFPRSLWRDTPAAFAQDLRAARLAQDCIRKVEVLEYPELGMEAVWRIEVVDFPAFIVIDDKGNDFFKELNLG